MGVGEEIVGGNSESVEVLTGVHSQSTELTRGPPELVQHFRL